MGLFEEFVERGRRGWVGVEGCGRVTSVRGGEQESIIKTSRCVRSDYDL
jgi:hypothetical protein